MLAKLVKNRREEMKLTQEELALAAKTTQATISRIESGEQLPRFPVLVNIAKVLQLNLDKIVEGVGTNNDVEEDIEGRKE